MNKRKKEQNAKANPQMTEQELLLAKETLRKAERDMFIYFIRGVMLYRLAEETKQRVYEDWKSEGFEETLHSAINLCNEMRDEVDKYIADLITIVPELEEFAKELKFKFEETNKIAKENDNIKKGESK